MPDVRCVELVGQKDEIQAGEEVLITKCTGSGGFVYWLPSATTCGGSNLSLNSSVLPLIYLDNNATTEPRQVVLEAERALQAAKRSIASHLGCCASELVLISGVTEANNLALTGVFDAEQFRWEPRKHVLVSSIEDPSVLEVAEALGTRGAPVDQFEVDAAYRLNLADLRSKLTPDTLLVSVMIAHRFSIVKQCVRVILLEQGPVVEDGLPQKVLKI